MFNIVICDDDAFARERIIEYTRKFFQETGEAFQMWQFSSGFDMLEHYPLCTDIILLDIEMGVYNGLEAAREIRKIAPDVIVIFITNLPQYALQSYEVKPFGFLTKPLEYVIFSREIGLAINKLRRNAPTWINVQTKGELLKRRLDITRIYWFEVNGHNISAVSSEETVVFRSTIKELETKITGHGYVRCHESYIVNIRFIKAVGSSVTMVNDVAIPISRGRKKRFMQEFANYIGVAP